MVMINPFKFSIRPSVNYDSCEESGASLESHFRNFLQNLDMSILEHRRNHFLFEWGQVLAHLPINLVMLFPKLIR